MSGHMRLSEVAATEIERDLTRTRDRLREILPDVIVVAMTLPGWPGTTLTTSVEVIAEGISVLEAAAGLMTDVEPEPEEGGDGQ